jgi:hypothetical protein
VILAPASREATPERYPDLPTAGWFANNLKDFGARRCYAKRRPPGLIMTPPPDPLDPLLDRWKDPEPLRSLAPQVWRRLAQAEERRPAGLWAELDAWLSRPPFAVLFVTCCALLGLFLAEVRVNRNQREHSAELARSYLQLIDPLMKTGTVAKLP